MTTILRNDVPTLDDKLDWTNELDRVTNRIREFPTPHVFGIHGDWGSGKTSFMRQVHVKLGGVMPLDGSVGSYARPTSGAERKRNGKIITIWFDAWRFQNEQAPIIALLQEMRRQMSAIPLVTGKFKKIGTIAAYSVLDSLSDIGKAIGFEAIPNVEKIEKRGEKWEKDHYAESLTTNSIRDHLHKTIKCLLPNNDDARVVIFIDDLDRCNPKAAMRLLEGLKIYMSIPNCIFVLGMNERILVDAIREEISAPKEVTQEELKLRASHYLEKICTDVYRLPLPKAPSRLLGHWLDDIHQKQTMQLAIGDIACLPPNPRRLKALANQWSRFSNCVLFPTEHSEQTKWAVRVLIAAYIHQFHRDLWERWHFNFNFWSEIVAWCNGEREKPKPDWALSLKMPHNVENYDETTSQANLKTVYLNPGDIDNFWIGALIQRYRDDLRPRDFLPFLQATGDTV